VLLLFGSAESASAETSLNAMRGDERPQRAWSVPAGHSPMAGRPVLLGLLLLLCHFGVLQACGAQQRGYQSQLW
jgi:hypothetical protein